MAERELQRHDAGRAGPEDRDLVEPERAEQGRRIVRVLRRAAARPVVATAPQGSAAIVGHDREVLETLGDCAPDLGIFAAAVDDQEGRS